MKSTVRTALPRRSLLVSSSENQIASGYFASLGLRDYRYFWAGRFISNLGTWIQNTAMVWALYDITGSAFQLGLNGLFRALPSVVFGLIAGALADRFDRRRIVLFADFFLIWMPLSLGILAYLGQLQAWHIYVVTFFSAVIDSLGAPARQALFPNLVPITFLPNAVALNAVLRRVATLVGPALAGVLIGATGTAGAFFANSVGYVAATASVVLIRHRGASRGRIKSERFLKSLRDGLAYVRTDPVLFGIVILEAITSLVGANQVFLTVFAKDILQVGPGGLGMMFSMRGVGGVLGSMGTIMLVHANRQGLILISSTLLMGLSFAGFGFSRLLPAALFFLFFMGLSDTLSGAARQIVLQSKTHDQMRGRANSLFQMTGRGLTPMGHTVAGTLIPLLSASGTVYMGAVVILGSALGINAFYPQILKFNLRSHEGSTSP